MAKKFKTNALRMLDKAKIPYSIKEYEYDEEHLDGRHVASQVDMDPNAIFKTLVLHDHHNEHLVCCVPVLEEIDLKKLAKLAGRKRLIIGNGIYARRMFTSRYEKTISYLYR